MSTAMSRFMVRRVLLALRDDGRLLPGYGLADGGAGRRRTVCAGVRRARRASEDRRLAVGAEDVLQREHDLALGGVRAGGVEQERHEVLVLARGRLAQPRELALDGVAVAARADGLHALDLLALERGVDAQRGQLARRPRGGRR